MSKKNMVFDSDWLSKDEFALEDEKTNLGTKKTGPILVIADLGLWNGRKPGYRFLEGDGTLDRVFEVFRGDFFSLWEEGGELLGKDIHHDGTNFYMFYEVLDREAAEEATGLAFSGKEIPEDLLRRGLSPLGKKVSEIYGWQGED